jgi:UDP-N-acetylmuramoylalanine--D-glutamate ligase
MRLAELAGRRVAVWGTGREGIAAVRAVRAVPGTTVIAADENPDRDVATWREAVGAVPLSAGEAAFAAMAGAAVVIKSPGVSRFHPWYGKLVEAGVTITSGTELWMADHADRAVGVTGSKGKSTTSSLIHHLLVGLGQPAELGGNIGVPMLGMPEADRYVVEMSSYQCADLRDRLQVAAVTALFPEHFDWHGGEEQYYRDKLNILAQRPYHAVVNGLDPRLSARVAALSLDTSLQVTGGPDSFHCTGTDFCWRDRPLFPRDLLKLIGRHNAGNLCVALGVLTALGIDCVARATEVGEVVAGFQPLPHRLGVIEDPSGLTFIDDTLSTTPHAAVFALEAFEGRPVTLIVGGSDRGLDYAPLRDYFAGRTAPVTVIGIPASGPRILSVLADLDAVRVQAVDSLEDAVVLARECTPRGGVVLLSPAAPSYGRFTNFEHRSAVYQEAITATAPDTP